MDKQALKSVVLVGYGKMGRVLEETLPKEQFLITERVNSDQELHACVLQDKIAIDFSTPQAFLSHYRWLADHCSGVLVGTTGWQGQHDEIVRYFIDNDTPMIYANNFSLGVNIYLQLVRCASRWTSRLLECDPYLLEMHHRSKLDRPSGTAVQLSEIIQQSYPEREFDVASLRVAEVKGMHQVGFESAIERLVFTHEAFSRVGFAMGVWYAARYLTELRGVMAFDELLAEIWQE